MPTGSDAPAAERRDVLTVPNVITVVRFFGVPLFVWLVATHRFGWGVLVLGLMSGTDWIDGFVARRFNQASRLGRILDPLADRVALLTVAVTLVTVGVAPLWFLLVLAVPDAILLVLSLAYFHGHPDLPTSMIGKVRTAALLFGTPLLLLGAALDSRGVALVAWMFLLLGLAGHLVAFFHYLRAMVAKHHRLAALPDQPPEGRQ